jgi:hypothetical protein
MVVSIARIAPGPFLQLGSGARSFKKTGDRRIVATALATELAGMAEYDVAGLDNMLVELQCPRGLAKQLGEIALALFDGGAAQVLPASSSRSKAKSIASACGWRP